jgi:hydrogenase nickel incorporation protein HypA/HybF
MHEWALAESVVETVKHHLEGRDSPILRSVTLLFGELQNIDRDIFEEGLKNLLIGEAFSSEVFHVEQERAVFRCNRCESQWGLEDRSDLQEDEKEAIHFVPEAAHAYMRCPGCSSPDFRVEKGRGVLVKSIVIDEDLGNEQNVGSDKLGNEQDTSR